MGSRDFSRREQRTDRRKAEPSDLSGGFAAWGAVDIHAGDPAAEGNQMEAMRSKMAGWPLEDRMQRVRQPHLRFRVAPNSTFELRCFGWRKVSQLI